MRAERLRQNPLGRQQPDLRILARNQLARPGGCRAGIQEALGIGGLDRIQAGFRARFDVGRSGPDTQAARMELYEHCLGGSHTCLACWLNNPAVRSMPARRFWRVCLHDVGKLFFFDLAPKTYSQIYPPGEDTTSVEQELEVFGKTHAELGMHFAIVSGLPSAIHDAIEHHHRQRLPAQDPNWRR